jgi:3-isopropylmalate dehydrogenase
MGIAASANLGDSHGMFEPVHGSAPKYAGQNITNPMAMINSVTLMFDWLGDTKGDADCKAIANFIDMAVSQTLMSDALTYDLGGSSGTSEVGDTIAEILSSLLRKHFATV